MQEPLRRMRAARAGGTAAFVLMLLASTRMAWAQDVGEARTPVWRIGASATLSATDNAEASSTSPRSGVGTEARIDLGVHLPFRRLRGFANYSLAGIASHTDGMTYRHSNQLHAELTAEVIESHAFLDMSADYGAQLGTVFGSANQSLLIDNANRHDTASVVVSPSLRWRLADAGRVDARLTDSTTRVKDTDAGDLHTRAGALYLDSGVRPRSSTWRGQAFGSIYEPTVGRRTTEANVRADVGWAFDAETIVSVVLGREGNDFESARRIYSDTYGLSADYRPNERTRIYAEATHRFFGIGHIASLSYRLPQFALVASTTRTSSRPGLSLEDQNGFREGSTFDVLYLQLASVEPDKDRRRTLVLDLLRANGIDPTQPVNPRLLTSGVLLVESNTASASWIGTRSTITLGLSGGSSRRLGSLISLPLTDQFSTEERIDQRGAQVIWIRRMTPSDDLSVSLDWTQSVGSLTQRKTTNTFGQLRWLRKIGLRSTVTTGFSHQQFADSALDNSRINTLSCEYRILF